MSSRGWLGAIVLGLIAGSSSPEASLAAAKATAPRPSPPAHRLPFISDDYARALAEARARRVPIFVEAWAPW